MSRVEIGHPTSLLQAGGTCNLRVWPGRLRLQWASAAMSEEFGAKSMPQSRSLAEEPIGAADSSEPESIHRSRPLLSGQQPIRINIRKPRQKQRT